jgi:hypothetical protein
MGKGKDPDPDLGGTKTFGFCGSGSQHLRNNIIDSFLKPGPCLWFQEGFSLLLGVFMEATKTSFFNKAAKKFKTIRPIAESTELIFKPQKKIYLQTLSQKMQHESRSHFRYVKLHCYRFRCGDQRAVQQDDVPEAAGGQQ